MKTFNLTRFIHVATRYETEGCVPSPMAANEAEPVWLVQRNPTDSAFDIRFGVGVDQWRRSGHGAAFGALLRIFRGKNYIVCWSRKSPNIDVLLRRGCSVDDELEALFFAVVLRLHMDHRLSIVASSVSASAADELQLVRFRVDASFPRFRSALVAAEWIVDEAQFDSKAFRFSVEGEETAGSGDWGQGKRR